MNTGKPISAAITKSQNIRFEQNGRITGAASGTWERAGSNGVVINVDGMRYSGVFVRQWEPESQDYVMTFSALSKQGVAIWGSKQPDMTDAEVVAAVEQDLSLGDTSSIIANLALPTEGTRVSSISWTSSNPAVITNAGAVTRPEPGEGDAMVTLTATITKGAATATKTFTVIVKERVPARLMAHYEFERSLADSTGQVGAGTVTGTRINNTGGAITYASGKRGDAAVFNGASGIRLPNGLIAGNSYSVALWVRPTRLTSFTTTFFGARDPNNWVSLVPSGPVGNQTMVWSGTAWYDAVTGMTIKTGEWTHLAFTVQDGTITVYVNGVQKFSGANFPNVFTTPDGTFGLGVNWWDTPYNGLMDDVRVYEFLLTPAEVAALAQP